jgi:ABC-type microcin C transport system permease subunit YejB
MCDPAHLFLILSLIFFFVLSYYDYYSMNASCMASYQCTSQSKPVYYYLLILGLILLWTWVLNFQCEMGYSLLVWAEIILPIALIYLGYQINWNPYARSPY